MKKITITTGEHHSDIIVGGKWTDAASLVPLGKTVIVTDENILRIYGEQFPRLPVFSIKPGESSKSLSTIEDIARRMLEAGVDRSGYILGIGGGVVCDISGFLASVYMRGLRFGFISSSLLSQVDASVGGKNGVNLDKVKNIIGTFNQPDFVICDPAMLRSLPEDEYLSGLAELIKMGAIMSSSLLALVEQSRESILKRDTSLLELLLYESVRLKASVVTEDEKESGKRMILNFGHTFGHIIEAVTGQKHGFAVAAGMEIAAAVSVLEGILGETDSKYLVKLLRDFSLLRENNVTPETYARMIISDKKRSGEDISFILLESPGNAVIKKIAVKKLADYCHSIKFR